MWRQIHNYRGDILIDCSQLVQVMKDKMKFTLTIAVYTLLVLLQNAKSQVQAMMHSVVIATFLRSIAR